MKKLIALLLVLVLANSLVIAAGVQGGQQGSEQGSGQGTGQGEQVQTEQQTQNQGIAGNLTVQQRQQLGLHTPTELRQLIQQRQQAMNQEMNSMGKDEQKVYQNQNVVRLAVHSLLAMENLTGGIGKNISQIAREFNNSVQATIRAEERIQTRSAFSRFFMGGDKKSAEEIEAELNRNRQRTEQLNQLRVECQCDEEIKAMMQEQIQNMEQEQTRLQQVAQNEKKSKGLFGWLFK